MTTEIIATKLLTAYKQPTFAALWESYKGAFDESLYDSLTETFKLVHMQNGRQALEVANLAELVAQEIGTEQVIARSAMLKGAALLLLHRYQEALAYHQQAEAYFTKVDDRVRMAGLRINQIAILQELGDYDEAIRLAELARGIVAHSENGVERFYWASLEMNISHVYRLQGDFNAALRAFQQAHDLFKELGNDVQAARANLNAASTLRDMDRFAEANSLIEAAQHVLQREEQHQEVARSQMLRGVLAYRRGDYQVALPQLSAAREGFAQTSEFAEIASVDLYRSYVYLALNLLPETIRMASSAAKVFGRNKQLEYQALALINEGVAQQRVGLLDLAEKRLAKARRLLSKIGALQMLYQVDIDRAALILERGLVATAKRILRRVRPFLDAEQTPALFVRQQLVMAACVAAEQEGVVPQETAVAYEVAQQFGLRQLQIEALHLQGQAAYRQGALVEAERWLETAVQKIHDWQQTLLWDEFRLGFMVGKLPIYDMLVTVSHARTIQDSQHIPYLLQHLNARRTPPPQDANQPESQAAVQTQLQTLRERWHWFQNRLENHDALLSEQETASPTAYQQELQEVENALAELVRQAGSEMAAATTQAENLKALPGHTLLKSIQQVLATDSAYLHYYIVDGQCHLLFVTQTSAQIVPNIAAAAAVEQTLQTWRFHIGFLAAVYAPAGLALAQRILAQLHQQLCADIATHLTHAREIFLGLPAEWQDIPFAACYQNGHYLAEQVEIAHLARPQDMIRSKAATESAHELALLVGHTDNQRLQHTLLEVMAIQKLVSPLYDAQLLLESDATCEQFSKLSQKATLIHLGTHAIFRDDNPFFSWLRLADNRLTVNELYRLRLQQRPLVVLSGCETGISQPRGGGMLGMARAFQAAGAAGLIASRWPIVDDRAAMFMHDFYKRYMENQQTASEALSWAKRQAIARGWHPFFWAGYLFVQN